MIVSIQSRSRRVVKYVPFFPKKGKTISCRKRGTSVVLTSRRRQTQ